MEIRPCTVDEVAAAPNFADLLEEYARESAINGMPDYCPDLDAYRQMEMTGALQVIAAFSGDTLMGFVTLLVYRNPHYSRILAVVESYFVSEQHRKGGTGLKLLAAAEELAESRGAVGMVTSAPEGGRLERVMPRVGYKASNVVFFRSL